MTKEELIEKLAGIEHQRWADWQAWCHKQGLRMSDGGILLLPPVVERWERQIATPYADLSEREKESDREQVQRYWPLIEEYIRQRPGVGDDPAAAADPDLCAGRRDSGGE